MTIVPAGEELIAETLLLNRDVGFVAPGMPAVIKLEAYPFTRHGYLVGAVESISPDAVADEQRDLIPRAHQDHWRELTRRVSKEFALTPG